jgi:hypothetical protein
MKAQLFGELRDWSGLREIRVRWLYGLHKDDHGKPTDGGLWFPDTPDNRRDLRMIIESACEVTGTLTHWLEEREA